MIKIGILAQKNGEEIAQELYLRLTISDSKAVIVHDCQSVISESEYLNDNGVDYMIIIFNYKEIFPVFLDILVLDNSENENIVSYRLVDCIRENTYLIYNTDYGYLPMIEHPKAIDYGLYPNSTVSFSSIEYNFDSVSVLLSVQRPIKSIFGNEIEIGEYRFNSINKIFASNFIAVSVCSILLDEHSIKNSINVNCLE